jgi:tetratricopeptide (TPR) repeat protein
LRTERIEATEVPAQDRGRLPRLKSMGRLRLSARARQWLHSAALAVFIAGSAVSAIELSRWHPRAERSAAARARLRAATDASASRASFAHDQRLVPVTPEPASHEAPKIIAELSTPPFSSSPSGSAPAPAPPSKFKSASELFADANQARVQGDLPAAIAICQQIEATFPNSTEGITTHLSLGVLYLQRGEPSSALQEFKIYRHIGASEMMAEALWGEEQAYEKLGRPSDERPVLEELLQNYPRSAYAAAAAQRLAALNQR